MRSSTNAPPSTDWRRCAACWKYLAAAITNGRMVPKAIERVSIKNGRIRSRKFTYVATEEGWLYLTSVMDLHSRKIVGWNTSDSMTKERSGRLRGLAPLRPWQPVRLSRIPEAAWDVLIYLNKYATRAEAQKSIFEYIEVFYNNERIRSSKGYCTPVDFKQHFHFNAVNR